MRFRSSNKFFLKKTLCPLKIIFTKTNAQIKKYNFKSETLILDLMKTIMSGSKIVVISDTRNP
jgi:hypothetical protein